MNTAYTKNNKINKLYFCQWTICGDEYSRQFKTNDLMYVVKVLERDLETKVEHIHTYPSGVIELYFDYVSVFIDTTMDELIDCEDLTKGV